MSMDPDGARPAARGSRPCASGWAGSAPCAPVLDGPTRRPRCADARARGARVCGRGALLVAYLTGLRIGDLLPASTTSFIATYVLSMAAALRLLRGPLRIGAAIALVACLVVFVFTGWLMLWVAGVTLLALLYTRSRL